MRVWDVHSGRNLLEVFTGHKMGETVMAVAIEPSNRLIATADSAGCIKVRGGTRKGGLEQKREGRRRGGVHLESPCHPSLFEPLPQFLSPHPFCPIPPS